MRLRFALLGLELKLLFLLLAEILLLTPVAVIILPTLPLYFAFVHWVGDGSYYPPFCIGLIALTFALRLHQAGPDTANDKPIAADACVPRQTKQAVDELARGLGFRAPKDWRFVLSPVVWRPFGCDLSESFHRNTIVVPLGCLETWSVTAFKCFLAHTKLRRRPPRRLFLAAGQSVARLEPLARRTDLKGSKRAQAFVGAYRKALIHWHFLADVGADAKLARHFGPLTVSAWIESCQLAWLGVPVCLRSVIEPAAKQGVLIPVSPACGVWQSLLEPTLRSSLEEARRAARRAAPGAPIGTELLRTTLLEQMPARPESHDPRNASTLFSNLDRAEEFAVRNELGLPAETPLRRAAIGEFGALVVMPQMREEVQRNADLLRGRSIVELPAMAKEISTLAREYVAPSGTLPDAATRTGLAKNLLVAWLAVELCERGWAVRFDIEQGLSLARGQRTVRPHEILTALERGEEVPDLAALLASD